MGVDGCRSECDVMGGYRYRWRWVGLDIRVLMGVGLYGVSGVRWVDKGIWDMLRCWCEFVGGGGMLWW